MTIPSVTEFEGQLPEEGDPASFPARAEALFEWLVGQGMPTFNAAVAAINIALNDNGTVLDTAGRAIALTTNANTIVATGGTGNAYTMTPAVSVPAYENGQVFMVRPDRQNTGPVTLQVGALSGVPVRKVAAFGTGFVELASGDWRPGEIHVVSWRSGQFELLTVPLNGFVRTDAPQTVTAAWAFQAAVTLLGNLTFGNPSQVRTALGASALGSNLFTAATALAARNFLGLGALATLDAAPAPIITRANLAPSTLGDVERVLGIDASTVSATFATVFDLSVLRGGDFRVTYSHSSGNNTGAQVETRVLLNGVAISTINSGSNEFVFRTVDLIGVPDGSFIQVQHRRPIGPNPAVTASIRVRNAGQLIWCAPITGIARVV